ncbi:MFS transporter [Paenibacillus ehimensis]|uniref:MFS transporter n=1 Tax=Paenibacillus ehimensis TaxID=79264 RepID=UPI000FD9C6F9|nr:MFS transporter [Paenibacillus ehimensis]MEC0211980.1 MFS transporter [Paenibacillus ehimensis]
MDKTMLRGKKEVLRISWITALCLMGDSMLYIVLPLHWKEAGLDSLVQVGLLLSVNRLVRLPLNPVVSRIYRHISLRQGMLAAVVLAILTTASYGFIHTFPLWVAARCVWGLAWSFLRLGAYYAILELCGNRNEGRLFGLYNGHYRLGSLVGMLLGGTVAEVLGLRAVAWLLSAAAVCGVPFLLRGLRIDDAQKKSVRQAEASVPIPQQRSGGAAFLTVLKTKDVPWLLAAALGSAMIYEGMLTSTLSNYAETRQASITVLGFTLGGAFIAGGLQALRWGWGPFLSPFIGSLSDRQSSKARLLTGTMGIAAALLILFPLPLPTWGWMAAAVALLITSTCTTTLMDALAGSVSGTLSMRNRRTVMTAYSVTLDIGAALGPAVSFWVVQHAGYSAVYWGAAVMWFGLCCYFFVAKPFAKQ